MATSNLFWRLFAQTGSIDAYLAYRRLHAAPSPT
ncbi:MAG TPA: YqzL family protein [Candidatus Nitrosotalea sp.]|nr:YqzL family protein [Candidatus Nitrosotalea sp.]